LTAGAHGGGPRCLLPFVETQIAHLP
jgi:hypothetical protein